MPELNHQKLNEDAWRRLCQKTQCTDLLEKFLHSVDAQYKSSQRYQLPEETLCRIVQEVQKERGLI